VELVDSGVTFHVTLHERFFPSYKGGDFGKVKTGNQVLRKIIGIGDITLITNTRCKLVLKNVRHVLDMCLNIIPPGKLDDANLVDHFGGRIWKLTKESLIIARGKKEASLYFMQEKLCKGEVNVAYDNSNLDLWHKRLSHMNEKGLQILAGKGVLPNIKGKSLKPCMDYLADKQNRLAFYKNIRPTRRNHILNLVHSNVYFVIFIDDCSRKV